ncbi:zonadhesin-like [Falco rusticolus]|uniref:zonadhesin-like n=1 Tax=Falco rusticolus TaxID=120794 RepID=UPI001886645D|nr:zonadhesin-like [Falco rusticolus]
MEGWRQQTVCGISCPANSNYSSCISACPASCSDLTSPSECESPCVEGCECLPGYVLSGFDCVPYKQCGCTYLDKYYEIGEIFTTDDCSQRCQCTESSTVSCSNIVCGSDEICGISNYSRGCYRSESTTIILFLMLSRPDLLLIGHHLVADSCHSVQKKNILEILL